ncbi:MAG: type II toxin-antitoxin system VapC family toxin [Acidobacteria bacterium]|nr:type II toxin-antitoxin system VapC family toxin [Acidobacteriota bacterium]
MSYLIDTNVISELRKGVRADRRVIDWFAGLVEGDLYMSVLTVGEIRKGIERIRRRDRHAAAPLERWLHEVIEAHRDRILPIDQAVAEEWGRLSVPDPLPAVDGLLAATAAVHGLVLVTRNVKDLLRAGVSLLNPFEQVPTHRQK